MCMQCMAGASACVASASGVRVWLATRNWTWLTDKFMKRATIALITAAVLASSLIPSSAAPPAPPAEHVKPARGVSP